MKRFFTFTALAILIVASAVFGVMEFKKEMTGVRQDLTDIKNEIAALKPLLEKPAKPVAPAPRPFRLPVPLLREVFPQYLAPYKKGLHRYG
jgi:hypothetical protein